MSEGFTAIIPLRNGSKGLFKKNIKLLLGKPLYQYTVDAALLAGAKRVIITTDIPEILSGSYDDNIEILARPDYLASDESSMADVVLHAIKERNIVGTFVLLQATSPLRSANDILAALSVYSKGDFELVLSVTKTDPAVLKFGFVDSGVFIPVSNSEYCFLNRQSLPVLFKPNGAIYIMGADRFIYNSGFAGGRIGAYEMPGDRSHDIDNINDFEFCARVLMEGV